VESKVCFKCGELKDISLFYKHSQMADGHLGKCIECAKKDTKARLVLRRDYVREYERIRSRSARRMEYTRRHTLEWRARNPEKYKAHCALNNALRDGKINKPGHCELCEREGVLHGHHYDYSYPLDVIWLCAECHGQIQ